jgi:hypothetical protein
VAELAGKGLVHEVIKNKFNIAGLSVAELEQDIDYILYVEGDVPIELYTKLEKAKYLLVDNAIMHADEAVRRHMRQIVYDVAKSLQDSVGQTVFDHMGETTETVLVSEKTNLRSLMEDES